MMVMAIAPSTPSMIFRMCCLRPPGHGAGPVPGSTMDLGAVGASDRRHDFGVCVPTLRMRPDPLAPPPAPWPVGRTFTGFSRQSGADGAIFRPAWLGSLCPDCGDVERPPVPP